MRRSPLYLEAPRMAFSDNDSTVTDLGMLIGQRFQPPLIVPWLPQSIHSANIQWPKSSVSGR